MRAFPHSIRPTGWFQIGYSAEFAPGDVKPLRYFGVDLVCYRGESGEVFVFDAHCPHLGAHLGHGGWVTGDDINCPFHGWRFDGSGANVEIPYSERLKQSRKCLVKWSVCEQAGLILLWQDARRRPPLWDPPELLPLGEDNYYAGFPEGARLWDLAAPPQVVSENGVDSAHFQYLHKASENPVIASYETRGHVFWADQRMIFGGNKEKTWLTPNGAVEASLIAELHGVGLNIARFAGTDDAVSLVAVTPVDEHYSHFRMTNWIPRGDNDPGDGTLPETAVRRIEEQFKQARRDFVVWENMRYVERAPLTPEESGPFNALRSWARQFYPEQQEDPGKEPVAASDEGAVAGASGVR